MRIALPRAVTLTFAALRHKNYRLWFIGQTVSLLGTWMQATAQGYLIYELTHSTIYLGYVNFAGGLPAWIFTLFAGVIIDRMPKRNLLVYAQTVMMIPSFILGALVFTGMIQPWHIVALAFLSGIANAFDAPARLSFAIELVDDREDLTNALALNGAMFNIATFVGPAIGAAIYAAFGPGLCFTLNGFSFLAVIAALLLMRLAPQPKMERKEPMIAGIKAGFQYVKESLPVRTLIIFVGVVGGFALGMISLMPAWAVNILGGDVKTNGALLSVRGLGALAGALAIAGLSRFNIKGKLWTIGGLIMPVILLVFSFVRWLPLSMLLLLFFGLAYMFTINTSNALVQTLTPDGLRGRVMSIYTQIFFGGAPLAALLMGFLADKIGEPPTIVLGSLIILIPPLYIYLRMPQIRALK